MFLSLSYLSKLAVLDDVRKDLHSPRDVLGEALGIEHSLFPRSVCIEVRPNVLHLQL